MLTFFAIFAAVLVWIATPAVLVWALATLRERPTMRQGLAKLTLGVLVVFLLLQEASPSEFVGRIIGAVQASVAALTALLGLIDLTAIKVAAICGREREA